MSDSSSPASGKYHFQFDSPGSIRSFGSPSSTHSASTSGYTPPRYYDTNTLPLPPQEPFQIHPALCAGSPASGRLNMLIPLEQAFGSPAFITPYTLSQSAVTPARSRIQIFLRETGLTITVGTSNSPYVSVYDVIRALHTQLLCRIPRSMTGLEFASAVHRARCAQYGSDGASELAKGPRFIDAFRGKCMWYGLKVADPTPGAEILALKLC